MNGTNDFRIADIISIVAAVAAVTGAALALCGLTVAGIVLGAIGLVGAAVVKVLGGRLGLNARLANLAFILGIVGAAFVALAPVLAAIIDAVFEAAQI